MIKVIYTSVDGVRKVREYKTLKGARAFAVKWVGETPDIGRYYAVSFDGIGKIEVEGVSLKELFAKPETASHKCNAQEYGDCDVCDARYEREEYEAEASLREAERHIG